MDSLDAFTGSFNEYLIRKASVTNVPISGTFELLPVCNMKCRMCYIQQDYSNVNKCGGLKDVDFWVKVFQEAADAGMLYPLITGGEPFLYPGFKELYEKIQRMGFHICINTNATLLDRKTVEWLSRIPPRRLNISLYGASPETYEKLCGYRNGFARVIQAFDLLKEYNIQFRIHTVLTPDNYSDYQSIIDICNQYEVPLQMTSYMFPPFRKNDTFMENEGRFTAEAAAQASFRYIKDKHKNEPEIFMKSIRAYCTSFDRPETYSLYGNNESICRGGRCTFWVNWHGCVSGCGVYTKDTLSLEEISFEKAWERIVANTAEIRLSEKCRTCRYRSVCMICASAAYCETGDVKGTPEYLCRYAEVLAGLIKDEYRSLCSE